MGVIACIALVVVGIFGFVAGPRLPGPSAERLGAVAPINATASDYLSTRAQNSPALVSNPLNPANLAVASRVDSQPFSCALDVSFDGGATWKPSRVPELAGKRIGCFAPDAAFGADGVLYVSFTSQDPVEAQGLEPDAAWLAKSTDGGRTLTPPTQVTGPSPFQLALAADPTRPGTIYLSWLQVTGGVSSWGLAADRNPIVVSRSADAGATWTSPVQVSPPSRVRVVAPSLIVGPDGSVLIAYLDVADDRLDYFGGHEGRGGDPYPGRWSLVMARSRDGAHWEESVVDAVQPTQRFLQLFPPTPDIAVNHSGQSVYIAFHDARLGTPDVLLWASADGGRSWRPPRQVDDTARTQGGTQYLPTVAVAANGRVDVVYYDRRADRADVQNEVSLQSSYDSGRTFAPRLRLSDRAFDSRIGFGSQRGFSDIGSRLGLLSTDRGALAVWTDTRGGTADTGKQDLARAVVAFSSASRWRGPLRQAGLGLAIAGVTILGFLWTARGREAAPDVSKLYEEPPAGSEPIPKN